MSTETTEFTRTDANEDIQETPSDPEASLTEENYAKGKKRKGTPAKLKRACKIALAVAFTASVPCVLVPFAITSSKENASTTETFNRISSLYKDCAGSEDKAFPDFIKYFDPIEYRVTNKENDIALECTDERITELISRIAELQQRKNLLLKSIDYLQGNNLEGFEGYMTNDFCEEMKKLAPEIKCEENVHQTPSFTGHQSQNISIDVEPALP